MNKHFGEEEEEFDKTIIAVAACLSCVTFVFEALFFVPEL